MQRWRCVTATAVIFPVNPPSSGAARRHSEILQKPWVPQAGMRCATTDVATWQLAKKQRPRVSWLRGRPNMHGMSASIAAVASEHDSAVVPQARPFVELDNVSPSFYGDESLLALDRVSIEVRDREFGPVVR